MVRWRRFTEVTGIAAGAVAAAVGAAVAAEKIAVGRMWLRPDPAAAEPLGQLRGRELTVRADDGVPLHTEIDGQKKAPVTIIFSHGYTLNQDCWHYQRRDLGAPGNPYRLVFWDQRSHGRSGRSDPGRENIDQLGRDLYAVIRAVAPRRRAGRSRRPLHGRHDDHGVGGAASGAVRPPGHGRGAHLHARLAGWLR